MRPRAGKLLANMRAAGVEPEEVGLVLLTHMHPDHVGGLIDAAGAPVFPRARVLVPEADAAVFLDAALAERVPEEARPVFAKARTVAAAYGARFERFNGDAEVAPGIRAVALPGHSPGHTGYRVGEGKDALLIRGDVVHVPGVQFDHPEVGMVLDADLALARQIRIGAFADAARGGYLIGGMHMPFPGLAFIAADGLGYKPVPILWDPGVEEAE